MSRRGVESPSAPRPVGPYSQAIVSGELLFCSGQIGLDPASGKLVPGAVEIAQLESLIAAQRQARTN